MLTAWWCEAKAALTDHAASTPGRLQEHKQARASAWLDLALGCHHYVRGRFQLAEACCRQAAQVTRRRLGGHLYGDLDEDWLLTRALIFGTAGNKHPARVRLLLDRAQMEEDRGVIWSAPLTRAEAVAYALDGNGDWPWETLLSLARSCLEIWGRLDNPVGVGMAHRLLRRLAVKRGEFMEAELARWVEIIGEGAYQHAELAYLKGLMLQAQGRSAAASEEFATGLRRAQEVGAQYYEKECRRLLAECERPSSSVILMKTADAPKPTRRPMDGKGASKD